MKVYVLPLLASLSFTACDKPKPVQSEKDKILYTVGQMYARRIDYLHFNKEEADLILQGARDWMKDQKSIVDYDATRLLVQKYIEDKMSDGAKSEKDKGKAYIEEFVKKGAKLTSTGLAYEIIKEGNSVKPGPNDTVEVHYHGTFIDGSVFDSSVDRKEKASFPLNVVIKGWQEALQMIGEGGEMKIAVPSDLAYGDRGSPPKIPGGATLLFTITLFKVTKR